MLKTNHIYNEDCLDTMAKMEPGSVDLIVTSPPYGNLRDYKGFSFNFPEILHGISKIVKRGGVVVWVVGDETKDGSESGSSFKQALSFIGAGFNLHDTMIYEREMIPLTHNRYEQTFEYMFIFSVGSPKTFNPIKIKTTDAGRIKKFNYNLTNVRASAEQGSANRHRNESVKVKTSKIKGNIWRYSTGHNHSTQDSFAFQHPAIFPERLAEDHIFTWSNPGDLVYDPMTGSGTVPKTAIKLKRNWIGSEISAEYCKIAQKRIKAEQQKITLF